MSMNRAGAIFGPDGQLLLPNLIFDKLFGGTELLDCINRDASANNGKSDRQITLADGRAFWVETIPMDGGWLVSAYHMTERSAKARTDTVTKLGNRLMFHEQLSALLADPNSAIERAAILTIDLARFKAVNESLGRHIGDGLLVLVADRIKSGLERGDIAARLEGDKFAIIQVDQPQPQSAAALADRLLDLIGRPYLVEGQLIDIAASAGIVLVCAGATDGQQQVRNAEIALVRAKSDGHGTYRFFETAMDARTCSSARNPALDLRRALALGENCAGLSASTQSAAEQGHRIRDLAALASSGPRNGVAARIYSGRRRYRHHQLDRGMGASDRVPGSRRLARRPQSFRQCFGDPVQEPQSGPDDRRGAARTGGLDTRMPPGLTPNWRSPKARDARRRRAGACDVAERPSRYWRARSPR